LSKFNFFHFCQIYLEIILAYNFLFCSLYCIRILSIRFTWSKMFITIKI